MRATFKTFLFGTITVTEHTARFIAQSYITAIARDGSFRDANGQVFKITWPTLAVASPDAVLEVVVTQVVGRAVPNGVYSRQTSAVA